MHLSCSDSTLCLLMWWCLASVIQEPASPPLRPTSQPAQGLLGPISRSQVLQRDTSDLDSSELLKPPITPLPFGYPFIYLCVGCYARHGDSMTQIWGHFLIRLLWLLNNRLCISHLFPSLTPCVYSLSSTSFRPILYPPSIEPSRAYLPFIGFCWRSLEGHLLLQCFIFGGDREEAGHPLKDIQHPRSPCATDT